MWLAREFPGLAIDPERANKMTPEEVHELIEVGKKFVESDAKERATHTEAIMRSVARF